MIGLGTSRTARDTYLRDQCSPKRSSLAPSVTRGPRGSAFSSGLRQSSRVCSQIVCSQIGLLGETFRLVLAAATAMIVVGGVALVWDRSRPAGRFRAWRERSHPAHARRLQSLSAVRVASAGLVAPTFLRSRISINVANGPGFVLPAAAQDCRRRWLACQADLVPDDASPGHRSTGRRALRPVTASGFGIRRRRARARRRRAFLFAPSEPRRRRTRSRRSAHRRRRASSRASGCRRGRACRSSHRDASSARSRT